MKQHPLLRYRRLATLLAAAFVSTPSLAQDAPAQEEPPVIAAPPVKAPPPAEEAPTEETPTVVAPAPPATARPRPEAAAEEPQPAPRATPILRAQAPAERTARVATTAPAAPAFSTPTAIAPAPAPEAAVPLPEATVQPLPAPAADPVAPPVGAAQQGRGQEGGSMLPWIIVGALVLGALALFALRRRRPAPVYRSRGHEAPAAPPPAAAAPAVLGGADQPDRPWLELLMQPSRAGVEGEDAVVEFLLTIDNRGSAPAEDVRISTWLVAAGDGQGAEIERAPSAELPSAIPAGEGRSIQTQVALPTGGMGRDTILPVVVADARYTLPDGSEGRTSASFAVGVPDGEELAHFSIREPSGLHEGVIARPLGEPERA